MVLLEVYILIIGFFIMLFNLIMKPISIAQQKRFFEKSPYNRERQAELRAKKLYELKGIYRRACGEKDMEEQNDKVEVIKAISRIEGWLYLDYSEQAKIRLDRRSR